MLHGYSNCDKKNLASNVNNIFAVEKNIRHLSDNQVFLWGLRYLNDVASTYYGAVAAAHRHYHFSASYQKPLYKRNCRNWWSFNRVADKSFLVLRARQLRWTFSYSGDINIHHYVTQIDPPCDHRHKIPSLSLSYGRHHYNHFRIISKPRSRGVWVESCPIAVLPRHISKVRLKAV